MNFYLLFKFLHLISIVSWFAGLLYLPRIFVYHSEIKNSSQSKIFKTMERKLYNFIMIPAMVSTWTFGLLLIYSLGFSIFSELWFLIKLISVTLLTIYHFYLGKCVKIFAIDLNKRSSKFYRIINEAPTILLITIIFLAVFKPL
jgi:putative membrane protein